MRTLALRFTDHVAPKDGTIAEHIKIIQQYGFVWYGKFGTRISEKTKNEILAEDDKRVLLIHSGTSKRYWLYIDDITYEPPDESFVPEYYRNITKSITTWFRVIRIEKADKNIMTKCTVSSSGCPLSSASRQSMSPFFIIDYDEGE